MIRMGTKLIVADNSGSKVASCIMLLNKGAKRDASIGDRIVVTIKTATSKGIVKEGDISKAVVVRTKKEIRRKNGEYVRFGENAVVLINDNGDPKGSRVFGPIARELKNFNYSKIVSLAKEVV